MKRIFFLWCLTLLTCPADSLDSAPSLQERFGPLVGKATFAGYDAATGTDLSQSNFRCNGLNISIISNTDDKSVVSITISRDSAFNNMEIPDILKTLSSTGDWTQKDDSTWTLSHSKIAAHWNGEGRISVETEGSSVPRGAGSYGN